MDMSKEDSRDSLLHDASFQNDLRTALKRSISARRSSAAANSPRRGQSPSSSSTAGKSLQSLQAPQRKRKSEESYEDLLKSYNDLTSSKRCEKFASKKKKNEGPSKDEEEKFGMSVCRMVKTKKGDSYRRHGDTCRVSGFALCDSYAAVIRKAAAPLLEKKVNYDMCSLIVSQAQVVNLPLEAGAWTLGGFLQGLGGLVKAKRLTLGVYMPESSESTSSETAELEDSTNRKPMSPMSIEKEDLIADATAEVRKSLQHFSAPIIDLTKRKETTCIPEGLVIEFENLIIGNKVGVGSWGVVCKGDYLGTEVAIKMINIPDEGLTKKTLTEVLILRELRHPNIITLMGACQHVNQLLIIMNYVDGCNLDQAIFQDTLVMEAVHISSLAKQVTRALAYMHSHDPVVIHQDLKPANVMVSREYHAYVCDLGVAKLQDQLATIKTSKGSGAGTAPYKAPEMFMDAKRSWQADIYSLGCLLIELSTRNPVWGKLDAGQITAKVCGTYLIAPQQPSTSEVPQTYRELCELCTRLNPAERPTAMQVLNRLNK